ncbi:MAG: hypothetical protein ABI197_09455 [Granulicella sp.]
MFGKIVLAIALLILVGATALAQEHPDLSGSWRINLAESDYGDLQGPDTRVDVIEQHDGRVSDRVTVEGRRRKQQYTLLFVTDGTETALPPGTKTGITTILTVSGQWQGNVLVVIQKVQSQGIRLVLANRYTLSGDGKTLSVTVSRENDSKALADFVFDRILPSEQ